MRMYPNPSMTGWEERAYVAFEGLSNESFHHTNEGKRFAYVEDGILCHFLGVTSSTFHKKVRAILTPDDVQDKASGTTLTVGATIYTWQVLEALLGVPGLIAKKQRVKVSAIMKRLYEMCEDSEGYQYRFETPEAKIARHDVERIKIKRRAAIRQRKLEVDRRKHPEKYAALFASLDNIFAAHADLFTEPTWRAAAMKARGIDTTATPMLETIATR